MNEELEFRDDFTARVFQAADAVKRRRARVRWAAAACMVAIAGVAAVSAQRRDAPRPVTHEPVALARVGSMRDAQAEPIDYMFPEAQALIRFSNAYSGNGVPENEGILPGYETGTAAGS